MKDTFIYTFACTYLLKNFLRYLQLYIVPQAKIFDDLFNNYRVFGTVFLVVIGLVVIAGVRVVNKAKKLN